MPEIRKLIKVGDSKGITIPAKWLEYQEKKSGFRIDQILLEINGELKIKPYIEKEKKRT